MTEAEFRQELKSLNGGYVLYGDEDYLKFSYSKEARKNVLDGMFDEFNTFHEKYISRAESLKDVKIFELPNRRWE